MTREQLPEVLKVRHIKEFLSIGKDQAYELVHSGVFHCVRVGKRILVPREGFLNWYDGKA
ncbi:DNA-binding protein [Paenibacillus selenitireducens]|uniref:DNA-binding protein n=1 Tax=Paenibacillus selenitireducens TaxID=1324314 RepID=A0A1T2XK91_9BACL|nr:helix-turn-helix domain-containing protein [Paenibacillus selenitireducens]OPA80238.1 DNA-binding protein [Paenibacillus selenitireducens]